MTGVEWLYMKSVIENEKSQGFVSVTANVDIDFKHTHWLPFYEPDCKACELRMLVNAGLDREMMEFHIHNSEVFDYWEKEALKNKYCGG